MQGQGVSTESTVRDGRWHGRNGTWDGRSPSIGSWQARVPAPRRACLSALASREATRPQHSPPAGGAGLQRELPRHSAHCPGAGRCWLGSRALRLGCRCIASCPRRCQRPPRSLCSPLPADQLRQGRGCRLRRRPCPSHCPRTAGRRRDCWQAVHCRLHLLGRRPFPVLPPRPLLHRRPVPPAAEHAVWC